MSPIWQKKEKKGVNGRNTEVFDFFTKQLTASISILDDWHKNYGEIRLLYEIILNARTDQVQDENLKNQFAGLKLIEIDEEIFNEVDSMYHKIIDLFREIHAPDPTNIVSTEPLYIKYKKLKEDYLKNMEELKTLEKNMVELPKARERWLKRNPNVDIPEAEMHLLVELEQLLNIDIPDCDDGGYHYFGYGINAGHVTKLILPAKGLTRLPAGIGYLVKLRILRLENNNLQELPDSIGELKSLEELNVSGNKLSCIPESMGNLLDLMNLFVQNNQLTHLPDSMEQLRSLTCLNLSYNKLTSVANVMSNLVVHLKELNLDGNPLPEGIWKWIDSWRANGCNVTYRHM